MTSKFSRVSGYNPRFITWWIKGCRTPTPVTFPTRRLATSTRQNLYALRTAMLKEGHHAALMIERGEIIQRPVDPDKTGIEDPHTLTIRPVNFDMNDLLDAAGINLPESEPTGDIPTAPPPSPRPFDYAVVMKSYKEGDNE